MRTIAACAVVALLSVTALGSPDPPPTETLEPPKVEEPKPQGAAGEVPAKTGEQGKETKNSGLKEQKSRQENPQPQPQPQPQRHPQSQPQPTPTLLDRRLAEVLARLGELGGQVATLSAVPDQLARNELAIRQTQSDVRLVFSIAVIGALLAIGHMLIAGLVLAKGQREAVDQLRAQIRALAGSMPSSPLPDNNTAAEDAALQLQRVVNELSALRCQFENFKGRTGTNASEPITPAFERPVTETSLDAGPARERYSDWLRGGREPENLLYVTAKAAHAQFGEVAPLQLTEVGAEGPFVLIRGTGGTGYVFPNPHIYYQEAAIAPVFPNLTEAMFRSASIEIQPATARAIGEGRWEIERRL